MLHQMNRPALQSPLEILCVLVLHLLVKHSCRGQSQLIGSSQPIVATVGGDIILPCQLKPAEDVSALIVEWTRPDLKPRFVHVCRAGQEVMSTKHQSYKGRTSLSINVLKQGDISLKLSKVKLSDEGNYTCYIPHINKKSFVELIVASDAVSSPVISLADFDRDRGRVVLQCESKGWHPQPEVFWLDSEENLLSAAPTETVRGPDDLYTVSSRVTVEKRLSNSFTCRVQQNNINQTRETHIIIAEDFFKAPPSSSPVIIGLAVGLVVCIVVVVAVFFFGWKWRQDMKTLRSSGEELKPLNEAGTHAKNLIRPGASKKSIKAKIVVEVDRDGKYLCLNSKKDLKLEGWKLRVKVNDQNPIMFTFEKSIKLKAKESVRIWAFGCGPYYPGPSDLIWNDLKRWAKGDKLLVELINCHEEIVTTTEVGEEEEQRKEQTEQEKEVETLKKELHTKQEELETKTKEIKELKAELQKLRDENQRKETDLQRQTEETNNEEWPDVSKHNDTNPAGKNSTEVFVEFDPDGKYIRLTTKSKEDLKLEGWKLRVKVNNENPIMFTFDKTFKLGAEESVYIWAHGCGVHIPPSTLTWNDLQRWTKGDKLLVELIKCHEEIVKTSNNHPS